MSLKEMLTQERIAKAFEKTLKQVKVSNGKLAIITEEYYPAVREFFGDSLLKDEPTCAVLNVGMAPSMVKLFEGTVKQNLSLMILDPKTNDIMGIRLIGVVTKDDNLEADDDDDDNIKSLLALWKYCDDRAEFYKHYNTKEALALFGLGVGQKYRRMGVAAKLMEAALCLIRNFEVSPIHVKGGTSSLYSEKIYEKLGFDRLDELRFEDYIVNGKRVIQDTGLHERLNSYGKVM